MKKLFFLALIFIAFNSCSKDNNTEPQKPIEEIVQIDVPEELAVYINVEIPDNTTKEDYILLDNKNRELPINSTESIKAETNTIVSLINKNTEKTIYIAYLLKDNQSRSKTSAKSSYKNNGVCKNPTVVGAKSTARFILASVLSPISVFHVGNSDRDAFYEMFKSNILCNTFSEEQILNVENAVKKLAEEGKDIAETAVSNTIKTIIEPITGGLFADCWEIGTELLFNGKIELEAHPYQEYTNSKIRFNSDNSFEPSVIENFTKFSNVIPNGIIIKDAVKLDNGNWKIKFDAYNSLPIPLGIRVGKLKEGTQYQIEPANDVTDYFIKSNGSSTIQMIKNGVTCQGFANNIFDSYYSLDSGGLAIRSSDFDKIEVELEFNPKNQYILFQGPNENNRVRIYHILESLSHIFDIIEIGDEMDKTEENDIYLELINSLVTNPIVISFLQTNSPNLKEIQKIIGKELVKYIKNSVKSGASSVLAKLLIEKNIGKTAVSKNLKIINTSLDVIDNINYLDAWSKIDNYTKTVKDYKLYIPSDKVNPVSNPNPEDGATNIPLSGDLSFTAGANTPTDAIYRLYYGTTDVLTKYYNLEGASYTYTGVQPNTTYYWKVETIDNEGTILATSPVWSFTAQSGSSSTFPGQTITVAGGTFQMGSNDGYSEEQPIHSVTLSSFSISKYEITNQQYADYMNAIGANSNGSVGGVKYLEVNSSYCQISHNGSQFVVNSGKANYPVIEVSWYGAKAYSEYYGGRLPTEAEWEFAARGGNSSNGYTYSGSNTIDDVAWYNYNSGDSAHTVGTKNANELGLHDMSGNVWEWCSDWYSSSYYSNSPSNNPQGPTTGNSRVYRGGSWSANYCRVARRGNNGSPSYTYSILGFRPVFVP